VLLRLTAEVSSRRSTGGDASVSDSLVVSPDLTSITFHMQFHPSYLILHTGKNKSQGCNKFVCYCQQSTIITVYLGELN
jgi:hypothetical protein